MPQKKSLFLALVIAAGCENSGGNKCSDGGAVSGTIISGPTQTPVIADLTVRGTINAPPNATVYRVQVAGIDAMNAGVDFDTWTATIPIGVLAHNAMGGMAVLNALATTNCSATASSVGTLTVAVTATPNAPVTRLALKAMLPNNQSYLPVDAATTAVIMVSGNPESAGALVSLAASIGTIAPTAVTLSGNGSADAVGYALFSSMTEGTGIVTAVSGGQSAPPAAIVITGPPKFAPDGAHVKAGQTIRATVLTTGKVTSCQATPAGGMHVTSGGDLMRGIGGVDQTMDGLIDIDVAVDSPLAATVQTTVSCRDPFGQVGVATFVADP